FLEESDAIRLCAYSLNGEVLAAALDDGTISFYSTKEWKYIGYYPAHTGKVWSIAFSSSGNYLASGGEDNAARLWN
ncbi:WD40-repeat-containing domain protein, partial [Mortierella sp. GBAus27b]